MNVATVDKSLTSQLISAYILENYPIVVKADWYKDGIFKVMVKGEPETIHVSLDRLHKVPWFINDVPVTDDNKTQEYLERKNFVIYLGIHSKTGHINYLDIKRA